MKLALILSTETINELLAACSAARTGLLTDSRENWEKFGQHRYETYKEAETELRAARDLANDKLDDAIRRADKVLGRAELPCHCVGHLKHKDCPVHGDPKSIADMTMDELARRAGGI